MLLCLSSRNYWYIFLCFSSFFGSSLLEFHLFTFSFWILVSLEVTIRMLGVSSSFKTQSFNIFSSLHNNVIHCLLQTKRSRAIFLYNYLYGFVLTYSFNCNFDRVDNYRRDSCICVQEGLLEDRDDHLFLALIFYYAFIMLVWLYICRLAKSYHIYFQWIISFFKKKFSTNSTPSSFSPMRSMRNSARSW